MPHTSNNAITALQKITKILLDVCSSPHELRPEVVELADVLVQLSDHKLTADIAEGETQTAQGVAVSPTMAAMCVEDYVRTIVFMRGLYAAIRSLQHKKPVRVLYIGCGPYATLALPLMSILSALEVQFELLDVHKRSIESVKKMALQLGVQDHISAFTVTDAATYQVDPTQPPDVVLMEIMQVCLQKEPQVEVSRHIMAQVPQAILVPENISIELVLIDANKEFALITNDKGEIFYDRKRKSIGTVFELNCDIIQSWSSVQANVLPAATIQFPQALSECREPKLFTTVQVFGEHCLREYDSGLTCPQTVLTTETIEPGCLLHFEYLLGKEPGLTVQVLEA